MRLGFRLINEETVGLSAHHPSVNVGTNAVPFSASFGKRQGVAAFQSLDGKQAAIFSNRRMVPTMVTSTLASAGGIPYVAKVATT